MKYFSCFGTPKILMKAITASQMSMITEDVLVLQRMKSLTNIFNHFKGRYRDWKDKSQMKFYRYLLAIDII